MPAWPNHRPFTVTAHLHNDSLCLYYGRPQALGNLLSGVRVCHNPDIMIATTERNEQYEIWVQQGLSRWEMLASFPDREIAFDLLQNRNGRTRLICVAFEHGRMVSQDLMEESGATPLDRRSA